jgi:hypothetical protein
MIAGLVTSSLKSLSWYTVEANSDSSAIRAQNYNTQAQNELSKIKLNLDLMRDNHCPAFDKPISEADFLPQAQACEKAVLDAEFSAVAAGQDRNAAFNHPIPGCDQSQW